jgi:hypothetical protein
VTVGAADKAAGAFDPAEYVVRRLREQRLRWVDLGQGRQVQVLVLRETEMMRLRRDPLVDIVVEQAVDWRGFSEAALLGAHDGASDPLPFSRAVWDAVARDSIEIVSLVGDVLVQHATEQMEQRAAAKKA